MKQKCERFQMLLQPIKHAINGAKFEFIGQIYNNDSFHYFTDNSMLLAHLEDELLPISNACRSYEFDIYFLSDYSHSTSNIIATILQFGQIDGCSNILFHLISAQDFHQIEIPVMSIANWLNRSSDTINNNGQVKKERILVIDSRAAYITNLLALVNGLKKVNF